MLDKEQILENARKTLELESKAIHDVIATLDDEFASTVEYLSDFKGRVIITGIGKSAVIAMKIVATLNSTGTAAVFMHAADAIHGDLGIIQKDDAVICISKSGNSPEIQALIPFIKKRGNLVVAFTANPDSYLAKTADKVISTYVEKEACPNNLAPTTSTTCFLDQFFEALEIQMLLFFPFQFEPKKRYQCLSLGGLELLFLVLLMGFQTPVCVLLSGYPSTVLSP